LLGGWPIRSFLSVGIRKKKRRNATVPATKHAKARAARTGLTNLNTDE
jgi:hypothetical protein